MIHYCVEFQFAGALTAGTSRSAARLELCATVLAAMKRRKVHRIPVTNLNGKLVGVIAQSDIAVTRDTPPEEVVDVVKRSLNGGSRSKELPR